MKNLRGTSWVAVLVVIVLGSALGIAAGTFLATLPGMGSIKGGFGGMFAKPFNGERYARILLIGEDDTSRRNSNGHGLSDTLVVLAIDTETKDVRAISIPRDTRVEIPGHGINKINAAHVFGGPLLTRQVVEDLLGVDIDYYIKTNTSGLRNLVDLVGGVYIVVDQDMHYTDRKGGLYINLKASPEKQLLNGRQAEGYVRFRHDKWGDSGYRIVNGRKVPAGRIVRQQYFLRALANRILSMPSKRDRLNILNTAHEKKYIVSDLQINDWQLLSDLFKDFDPTRVQMDVLPGAPGNIGGVSYWLPDEEEVRLLVKRNLLFEGPVGEQVAKVEVLNGSGINGLARKVASKLREAGFEVTRTDNAKSRDYKSSCVITNNEYSKSAEQIADLLHCEVISGKGSSGNDADVTVIVGRDFKDYN